MGKSIGLGDLYVILVEPSTTQLHIISDYLKYFGLTNVERMCSGAEALAAMAANSPDLVISTMYLPDMTGADLVTRMRADEGLRNISFILISSETSLRYLDPIRQAGVVAILPKPFVKDQLKRALHATLDFLEPDSIELQGRDIEELVVLIVDDSMTARHYTKRTLNALGIEHITEADNGVSAVELINGHYFDLIVTDYNMPAMDGGELVTFIRNNSQQSAVPILMVTSENDMSQLAAIEQSGVSAICDKPFEINTFRNLISNILA